MSHPRIIRCYEYVTRPYGAVRGLLHRAPLDLLHRATTRAAARSNDLAGRLNVDLGGIELGVEVALEVQSVTDGEAAGGLSPVTRVAIGWQAARAPSFFPLMSGHLSAWPLTTSETQIELEGSYTPPLGALGVAIDAAVGRRVADAAVRRFVEDVVERIRDELPVT
jgi:hypothetical protein